MLPGRTAPRPVASDPCRARPRRARVPGPSTSRLASRRHFLFRANADDARPVPGGTPPPGPPPRVGHRRRPGGGLPGRTGRPHAPPRGRLAEGQGASFRPGCVFLTDLAGDRTGTREPPEFTATAAGKGSGAHAATRGEKGDGRGGPRLRQARPGRHPEPRRPPARASRSVPGSSASPTGIYSCLNICVDFFFLKKNQTQLFKHFKHRI